VLHGKRSRIAGALLGGLHSLIVAQHSAGACMLHCAPGTARYVPDVRSGTRRSAALEMLRHGRLARSVPTGLCWCATLSGWKS